MFLQARIEYRLKALESKLKDELEEKTDRINHLEDMIEHQEKLIKGLVRDVTKQTQKAIKQSRHQSISKL